MAHLLKSGAIALAMTALFCASANAATMSLNPAASLPAPGRNIPAKLPMTTSAALPVGVGADVLPGSTGKPGASGLTFGHTSYKQQGGVVGQAYGSSSELWPYTTARVASSSDNGASGVANNPVSSTPYRQTGMLLVQFPDGWYQCTASLILPNVLVTAAHCMQDFGQGSTSRASAAFWIPANSGNPSDPSTWPFGGWTVQAAVVPDSYINGRDTCATSARGIACNNDLAVLALAPLGGQKAATVLGGYYAYGTNGYSFVRSPAFKNAVVADITQLGYPGAFDDGVQMQRNNSFGKLIMKKGRATTTRKAYQTIQLGSALSEGASGGPLLVNFGTRPVVDAGASLGNQSASNVVVGVTSYGYATPGLNVQGGTFFGQNAEYPLADYGGYGAGNIGALLQTICASNAAACTE